MKSFNLLKSFILISTLGIPAYGIADDTSSKLTNQSKQNGANGYYLVREKIIAENNCVNVEGSEKLNPGDSANLKIKPECKWGVVQYKIYNVDDNKEIGKLGHSYHDGNFTIEITSTCEGKDCNFTSLLPEKMKSK